MEISEYVSSEGIALGQTFAGHAKVVVKSYFFVQAVLRKNFQGRFFNSLP